MADYLYDFPNTTVSGGDQLVGSLVEQIPILPGLGLLVIYFIIVISGTMGQAAKRGYVDFAMWSLLGMVTVDILALLMTLGPGIISPIVLGVCFGITILNAFWFFMTFGRFEQS